MIRIQASVGRDGRNRFKDVTAVQTLLNDCIHLLIPLALLEPDGKNGRKTIGAIEEFQRRVLKIPRPDGRVDPGGRTLLALNRHRREAAGDDKPSRVMTSGGEKFPLAAHPAESYKEGMRRFGARRKGGRKHAGCDLYGPIGTPIYALADGEVLQNLYHFYLGTYALEVRHADFVARYGEIQRTVPTGVKKGARIERGQLLGYIGELKGLNMSMLHLELYSGKSQGPMTVRNNKPYMRRSDLIDPTPILDRANLT